MSSEETTDATSFREPNQPAYIEYWDNDPASTHQLYVNSIVIDEGTSDITIQVGSHFTEYGILSRRMEARLILTHSNFLDFAKAIQKQADFLTKLYNGTNPSISDVPPEVYNEFFEEIYGSNKETSEETRKDDSK